MKEPLEMDVLIKSRNKKEKRLIGIVHYYYLLTKEEIISQTFLSN
jgi:hypothetical protein